MENKELLPTLLDIDVYTVEDYQVCASGLIFLWYNQAFKSVEFILFVSVGS